MIDLWKLLDKTCPGSIPPGIIFLPGEKLKDPAFGWAPKTWLSNEELEYPDPLSNMVGAARLVPEGLLVQYPGFVLHGNRASILRENESSFHFPSDSTLLEWYGVEFDIGLRNNPPKGIEKEEKQLAIILCRPKPKELREIALLVEIEEIIKQRSFGDKHHHSVIYHVSYDRRVKIWRETDQDKLATWREYITAAIDLEEKNISGDANREDKMICGEALDSDQRWYVGGRPLPGKPDIRIEDEVPRTAPAQRVTAPTQIPVESGAPNTNVRTVRRNGPIMINSLSGPGRVALANPTYGSSFARPTPTAVPAAQNPLLQASESSSPDQPQRQTQLQTPILINTSGNQFHTLMSQPASTFPPTPARSRTRSTSAVSTSAASNNSATHPVTPDNGEAPGNLPTPPETESPSSRSGRPRPAPPVRPSTTVSRSSGSTGANGIAR
jgi:hypothetical protein